MSLKMSNIYSLICHLVSLPFFLPACSDQTKMGKNCNISSTQCSLLDPCENNGTCFNTITNTLDYTCNCTDDFGGMQCQNDLRSCKLNSCLHNGTRSFSLVYRILFDLSGTCIPRSNKTLKCLCSLGWTGNHCENMINYCVNVTCENRGVCRPLFMDYKCECLGESFSGQHCEKVARKIALLRAISKSVGYIAIIFLVSTASFFVIMDILKYCFGIDVTKDELDRVRRNKVKDKAKRRPVVQRFTYVHASSNEPQSTTVKNRKQIINIQEATT